MIKKILQMTVLCVFLMNMLHSAVAQTAQNNTDVSSDATRVTPFSQYTKLVDEKDDGILIYGSNASLFTPYSGPEFSTDPAEEIQRKRYGTLQLSPSLKVYLDYISDPMGGTYELIHVENNQVVGQLIDSYNTIESLYINGSGQLYVYSVPTGLCWGRTTYKYELQNDVLVEVQQPFYYVNDKSVSAKVDLLQAPVKNASKVASLQAGTEVNVIGVKYEEANNTLWFLIQTPLGLIGWAMSYSEDEGNMYFDITQCN